MGFNAPSNSSHPSNQTHKQNALHPQREAHAQNHPAPQPHQNAPKPAHRTKARPTSFSVASGGSRPGHFFLSGRRKNAVYWQPENASVAALTLVPGVTARLALLEVELVCKSDGLQSSAPPPPETKARASTV